MNNIQLNIVANAQFQQVYAEVAKLKTAMNSLQKTSVGGPFTSAVTSDIKAAQSQFDSAVQSTRAFTIQQVAMTDSVNKFGQQLSRGQLSLSNYYKIWRDSAKGTSAEIDALATAQARLNRSIAIADPLKPGYAKLVTDINGVVTAEEKMLFKQQALNTALNQGSMKLIDFGKNTQWMGRQLTVGLTMPLAMFGATAAQTFLQVDQELTRMQKVYGTGLVQPTAAALKQIRSDVSALGTELARSLGISVKDTASMAADLAATGLQGAALVNATRQALRMSVLGELDHQQAMQATISLQNVYKLNTQGLADAVNFLNAVENQTSTSLKDLVDAIPRVGPIVQQLGGSFKDTAAMMVAMKEAGVPAAQGANAIKSALSSLINPTTSAAKAFAAYNINLKNIASETGGNPIMMLKALSSEIKNLDRLTQAQLIEKLFGKFQYARIQALLDNINKAGSQTATVFQLMGASGTDLANLATNELKQQTESASGKFKRMTETIKADLLPIGQSFLESFTKIGNAIDKVVSAFRTLGNFIGPVAGMLGKIFGGGIAGLIVVGPIIMLVGLFSNLIGNILRGANAIRMFKQGLESASSGENKFLAGLQGMRNFYQELDTSVIASRNQMDLMPEAITSNAKAFEILRNEIARLTDQFRLLAVAQTEAMGMSSLGTALAPFGAKFLPIVRKNSGGLLPGFANGGFVYDPSRHGPVVPGPSNVNYDSVLGSVPKGGFVVNKKSSAANPQLKSIPKFNSGGNMMAMLTPGEIVIDPKTTSNNLGMLEGINSGMLHLARGGAIGAHHRRSPVYSYTGSDVYRGQTRRMKASLGIHYNAYKAPHTRGLRGWASGGILGGLIHSSKSNYGSPYEGALAKTKIQTGVPGEHQGVADQLGLFARGSRGSDWFNRSGGTVLPSFTVATPSKNTPGGYGSFNTELVTGHASGEDWIRYANENRGASSHTGMEEFLKAANPNDPTKNKAVLEKIHKIFTERIKGYAGNLSDAIFSQEAFKAYDEVINKEFNDNPGVRKAYELEKTAIGAARTAPSKSGNRGNRTSGGSPVNVTSGGIIPFFRSLSKTRREKYQDSAFESHIFAPEYLEKMSEVPGINVHSGGMIEKRGEADAKAYKAGVDKEMATAKKSDFYEQSRSKSRRSPHPLVFKDAIDDAKRYARVAAETIEKEEEISVYSTESQLNKIKSKYSMGSDNVSGSRFNIGGMLKSGRGRIDSMLGGIKNMSGGKIGAIGLAGSMALSAMPNQIAGHDLSGAKDIMSGAMSAASMAAMIPGIGTAVAVGIGSVVGGFKLLSWWRAKDQKAQKDHEDAIRKSWSNESLAPDALIKKLQENVKENDKTAKSYNDMTVYGKMYGDTMYKIMNDIKNGSLSGTMLNKVMQQLKTNTGYTAQSFISLKLAAVAANDTSMVNLINGVQKVYGTTTQASNAMGLLMQLAATGINTSQLISGKQGAGILSNKKDLISALTTQRDLLTSQRKAVIAQSTPTSTPAIDSLKKQTDAIDKQIKQQEVIKKNLDDQLKVMELQAQTVQQTNDYYSKQMDLTTQIKQAEITGNYLQAAALTQSKGAETAKYQQQQAIDAKKAQVDSQQGVIDALNAHKTELTTQSAKLTDIANQTKATAAATGTLDGEIAATNRLLTEIRDKGGKDGKGGSVVPTIPDTPSVGKAPTAFKYNAGGSKANWQTVDLSKSVGKVNAGQGKAIAKYAQSKGIDVGGYFTMSDANGKSYTYYLKDNGKAPSEAILMSTSGKATGGMVFGPGTTTSDSIMTRLSRGEYVVKADAVGHYGAGMLSAINNKSFNVPRQNSFSAAGSSSQSVSQNITFHINGSSDPQAVANMVMAKLKTVDAKNNKTNMVIK